MYLVVRLAHLNYVGELLVKYVTGEEESFILGTPHAQEKDSLLVKELSHNVNVCNANRKYVKKFALKMQTWINGLVEENTHKLSKKREKRC